MHADKQEDSGITLTIKFDDNRELRQDAPKLKILQGLEMCGSLPDDTKSMSIPYGYLKEGCKGWGQ